MEIGISRGQFSVIRVFPNPKNPEGAFVIRVQDQESGITFVTTLNTEDGLRFAGGFNTDQDAEHAELTRDGAPAPVIALPNEAETRVHGGGNDRRVPIEEPEPEPAS